MSERWINIIPDSWQASVDPETGAFAISGLLVGDPDVTAEQLQRLCAALRRFGDGWIEEYAKHELKPRVRPAPALIDCGTGSGLEVVDAVNELKANGFEAVHGKRMDEIL